MNYTIPSILAVTVLIAGIFALLPVDKATAVHDTIIADLGQLQVATANDVDVTAGTVTLIADSATIKTGTICALVSDTGTDGTIAITGDTTATDAQNVLVVMTNGDLETGSCEEFNVFNLATSAADAGEADVLDYVIIFREQT